MSEVIQTTLDASSTEFRENAAHHRALAQELRALLETVRRGGPEKAVERHR